MLKSLFKNLIPAIIISSIVFGLVAPVVQSTNVYNFYVQISVSENSGIARSNLSVATGINITNLINTGYLNAQASNNNLVAGSPNGNTVPYMLKNDNLYFYIDTLAAFQTRVYYLLLQNTPNQTAYNIVIGNNNTQNITIPYTSSLNPGTGNWSVNFSGINSGTVFNQYAFLTINYPSTGTLNATLSDVIAPLNITGNGSTMQLTGLTGASTAWQSVLTNDGNTSYVNCSVGAAQETDLFTVTNLTGNTQNITSVGVFIITSAASAIANSYALTAIKTNGVIYFGDLIDLSAGSANQSLGQYLTFNTTYTTNPNTGLAWTWNEVGNMQPGISMFNAIGQYTRCTQVYAIVTTPDGIFSIGTLTFLTAGVNTGDNISVAVASNGTFSIANNGTTVNYTSSTFNVSSKNITLMQNMAYLNYFRFSINSSQKIWYSPNATINGTNMTDFSGNNNNGIINYGVNPNGIIITIGQITPVTSLTPGAVFSSGTNVIQTMIIPSNWYAGLSAPPNLPFFSTFNGAASNIGMSTATLYTMMIIAIASAVGLSIGLFTGSTLLVIIGITMTLGVGVGMTLVGGWMIFAFIILGGSIWYLSRRG